MDRGFRPKLKPMVLFVFLLVSTNIVCLQGNPIGGHSDLHCVTDYLVTINCTLSITPSGNTLDRNSSYWLNITDTFEKETSLCILKKTHGHYFCSVEIFESDDDITFTDTDLFDISLCHKESDGSEHCEMLQHDFTPCRNIKPIAPSNLTVSTNSSQHHFTWKNSYENYNDILLVDYLKFQLNFFTRGNNRTAGVDIYTDETSYSVDDEMFVPDTEYTARVRSSPSTGSYKGEWSDWSPEVHWTTEPVMTEDVPNSVITVLIKTVFIPLCVMTALVSLMCCAPFKKWRQSALIPTPAPYFDALYSECQGDFKSWVITQENTVDMLKAEASLQIDTLTKITEIPEEDRQAQITYKLMEGSAYSNLIDPVFDSSLLGIPYAVSTMAPLSTAGSSLRSLTLSCQPESHAEGDSGCWLCSDMSLEKDSPWYCNEYCTLSSFQQSHLVAAMHHGSLTTTFCLQGNMKADVEEASDDVFIITGP